MEIKRTMTVDTEMFEVGDVLLGRNTEQIALGIDSNHAALDFLREASENFSVEIPPQVGGHVRQNCCMQTP